MTSTLNVEHQSGVITIHKMCQIPISRAQSHNLGATTSHPAAANKILQSFASVKPLVPYFAAAGWVRNSVIPQRVEFPFRHSILLTHHISHPRHSFELTHSFGLRRTVKK